MKTPQALRLQNAHAPKASQEALEAEARELSARLRNDIWRLGQVLRALSGTRGSYCGGKYTSFAEFVKRELGIDHTTAHAYMRISEAFSPEQAKTLGFGKCKTILAVTQKPTDRARALAMAEEGAKLRDIVRVFRPERTVTATVRAGDIVGGILAYEQLETAALALPIKERMQLATRLFDSLRGKKTN